MDELEVEAGVWFRQGCSIIWEPKALARLVKDNSEITPISAAIRYYKAKQWPDPLPAHRGRAMVIVGLEGCLESLDPQQREKWLKDHIKPLVIDFYRKFQTQCSLIFYFERGKNAFKEDIENAFLWKPSHNHEKAVPLVKFLYGGTSKEVKRLVSEKDSKRESWGLYVANPS